MGISNNIETDSLSSPEMTDAEIRASSIGGIKWQELYDNNHLYKGKIVHYTGKVIQLSHQYGDVYFLNVRVGDEKFRVKYFGSEPEPFTQIDFYGKVTGTDTLPALLTGATLHFVTVDGILVSFPEQEINSLKSESMPSQTTVEKSIQH